MPRGPVPAGPVAGHPRRVRCLSGSVGRCAPAQLPHSPPHQRLSLASGELGGSCRRPPPPCSLRCARRGATVGVTRRVTAHVGDDAANCAERMSASLSEALSPRGAQNHEGRGRGGCPERIEALRRTERRAPPRRCPRGRTAAQPPTTDTPDIWFWGMESLP
jgi:hypothetical protein